MRRTLRSDQPTLLGVEGTLRRDRRLPAMLGRLRPGDVALVDALDLDATTARALIARSPAAVLNTSSFISGRLPNLGPRLLAEAGIVLLETDAEQARTVPDGAAVRLEGGSLVVAGGPSLDVRPLDLEAVASQMTQARSGMSTQLTSFAHNTAEHLRHEEELLLHGAGLPELALRVEGRAVVVVSPRADRADVKAVRRFVREQRPVLVGVGSGADLLLARRMRPDLVFVPAPGPVTSDDADRASEKAVRAASEVVVHSRRDGDAARAGLDRIGVSAHEVRSTADTLDLALLTMHAHGARLLVPVGVSTTLEEFVDGARTGQSSTFLTRLRVGSRLVDASVLPHLYAARVRWWHLLLVVLAGLLALALAVGTTPVGQDLWDQVRDRFSAAGDAFSAPVRPVHLEGPPT